MDARLRPITSTELAMELNKLFNALELKTGSPASKMDGYILACQGQPYQSLKLTIEAIISGSFPEFRKWCPTAPELGAAVRDHAEKVKRQISLAEERMQIEDNRPVAVPVKLVDRRVEEARARMAAEERALLFTVSSDAEFYARRREVPSGGTYMAILSAVYGAKGSANYAPAPADVEW